MSASQALERVLKYLFVFCACGAALLHFQKDDWPEPGYYDPALLGPPVQTQTARDSFDIEANGRDYTINPKFDYDLRGVVVSYSDADGFTNIWHHRSWQDFINVRDLCVIWGRNVESGVYRNMGFRSDSWTCWASWPDRETGEQFTMNALSNNHIVTDSNTIKAALMKAEPGDLIHLKGVLAEYVNHAAGYTRGTSTTRNDTGQGACETIYVDDFEILQKANPSLRKLASTFNWLTALSLIGYLIMFFVAPARPRYR